MNCISYTTSEGNFNWCDIKQVDVQYMINYGKFKDVAKELGLSRSFLVNKEYDCGYEFPDYSVLDICEWIKGIYENKYMLHCSMNKLQAVIDFLQSVEKENERLTCEDMIEKLNKEIEDRMNQIDEYEDRLFELE